MENEVKALEKMGLIDHIPRAARYAVCREAGATQIAARDAAGYGKTAPYYIEKTNVYKKYREEIRRKRQELSAKHGLRLEDSADFYKDMSKDKNARNSDRIRAREVLDKLMGYFAPMEVERTDDAPEKPSISILSICQEYHVSPAQLLQAVQDKTVKHDCKNATDVTPAENDSENGNLALNNAASNNYYVNSITEMSSGAQHAGKDDARLESGAVPPEKNFGWGGGSGFQEPVGDRVPSPYHEVHAIYE